MKRKYFARVAALLLVTTSLTSCGATSLKTSFKPYWQENVIHTPEHVSEELTYDVIFNKSTGTPMNNYTLAYNTGTFQTKLKTTTENGAIIYEYSTKLEISGSYTADGKEAFLFEDFVSSKVIFKNAANGLTPISSYKEFISHSPRNTQVDEKTDFSTWKESGNVSIDYTTNTSIVTLAPTTPNEAKQKTEIALNKKQSKYSYVDNEQIWIALRALEQSATASAQFAVYAPFSKQVQMVSATFDTSVTEENFTFILNGTEVTQNVTYFPVNLVLNEKNSGAAQKLWIAAAQNVKDNKLRNVVLKNVVEISFGIGTLTYQLKEANFNV